MSRVDEKDMWIKPHNNGIQIRVGSDYFEVDENGNLVHRRRDKGPDSEPIREFVLMQPGQDKIKFKKKEKRKLLGYPDFYKTKFGAKVNLAKGGMKLFVKYIPNFEIPKKSELKSPEAKYIVDLKQSYIQKLKIQERTVQRLYKDNPQAYKDQKFEIDYVCDIASKILDFLVIICEADSYYRDIFLQFILEVFKTSENARNLYTEDYRVCPQCGGRNLLIDRLDLIPEKFAVNFDWATDGKVTCKCGWNGTEQELRHHFVSHINRIADSRSQLTLQVVRQQLENAGIPVENIYVENGTIKYTIKGKEGVNTV